MSSVDYLPPPTQQNLTRNPMLPQHPVTTAYDAQYAADEAVLRANIARQYSDILQQLGYTDESGNFIPGSITTNARRQQSDLNRSSDLAAEDVTNNAQRQGTLFSGRRGTEQARAQYPFQQAVLDLGINVPLQLSQLYEQAAGLTDQYTLQNNQLMAQAAQRTAGSLTTNPPSDGSAPPTTPTVPQGANTTGAATGGGGDVSTASGLGGDTVAPHDLPLPDVNAPLPSGTFPNTLGAIQNAALAMQHPLPQENVMAITDPSTAGMFPDTLGAIHRAATAMLAASSPAPFGSAAQRRRQLQ